MQGKSIIKDSVKIVLCIFMSLVLVQGSIGNMTLSDGGHLLKFWGIKYESS